MKIYEPIIGLEIHVELNTKTKMFCSCSADYFGKDPNSNTCPVCLGLPGALPVINEEAIKKCLMIGRSFDRTTRSWDAKSLFERKNYFYPDLPKGYQISQYRWPLSQGGWVKLSDGTVISIDRVHQEEDTGKLIHSDNNTLVDFNRSGVPLVEIVTKPSFKSSDQVREFAKKIQLLLRTLKVSEADMEKGQMRLEANVSVATEEQASHNDLPDYRIELKNINSFSFMGQAIDYEIKRQSEALDRGEKLTQETRGWDQEKKCTYLQRSKEEAHDYRYFPEPDLPELLITKEMIKEIDSELPELPWEAHERLVKLGVTEADAAVLIENSEMLNYFEEAAEEAVVHQLSPKEVVNPIINKRVDIKSLTPKELVEQLVSQRSSVISDDSQIQVWVDEVISENPSLVEQYKSGKVNVIQSLIGKVMAKSAGKADAIKVKEAFESTLS